MTDYVDYFETACTVNARMIEEAAAVADYQYELGNTEEALVYLLDELHDLVYWSRNRGLEQYRKKAAKDETLEKGLDSASEGSCVFTSEYVAYIDEVERTYGPEVAYDLVMSALGYAISGKYMPLDDRTPYLMQNLIPLMDANRAGAVRAAA